MVLMLNLVIVDLKFVKNVMEVLLELQEIVVYVEEGSKNKKKYNYNQSTP